MKKRYKTTAAQFDLFVATCKAVSNVLGLNRFCINYYHGGCKSNYFADCCVDFENMRCDIRLAKEWPNIEPTNNLIIEVARHEVSELLLRKMSVKLEEFYSIAGVCEWTHEVIQALVKVPFETLK